MTKYALDASALLALLNEEEGCDVVLQALPSSIISSVNLSEVITILARDGMSEEYITSILKSLNLAVIPFDEKQGYSAGMLYNKTKSKGLSFGDRACLSVAMKKETKVLTADSAWYKLDCGVEIDFIR